MAKQFDSAASTRAVDEALDNWDFTVDGRDDGEKLKRALEGLRGKPFEVPAGFRDEWDWLAEYASATAADM